MVVVDWGYSVICSCGLYIDIPFTDKRFIEVTCSCGKSEYVDLLENE